LNIRQQAIGINERLNVINQM